MMRPGLTGRTTMAMRRRRVSPCILLLATGLLLAPSACGEEAVSIEKGRDVGDSQVLYDIPYDPRSVADMTFVYPTAAHPVYEVVVPLGDWTEGTSAAVREVRVNRLVCESYNVFADGVSHVQGTWITQESRVARNVVIAARALWHNDEPVTVDAVIHFTNESGQSETVTKTVNGKAPPKGGGPTGWRRYQSVVLHEPIGLDRTNEPVEFSLAARVENCGDLERELRLFAYDPLRLSLVPVDFQVFDARDFPGTPPGTTDSSYLKHASRCVNVVFPAAVPANESGVFLAFYDNPSAPTREIAPTDLVVSGGPVGGVVENRFFRVTLDDRSGQIASFELKGRPENPAPPLTNSYSYAAHWNPDSFTDNGYWGHTFAWDPPDQTIVTARGPILFRVTHSGRMPEYTPQVRASVSYSFYASVPYVKVTTVTEVRDPTNVSAIRNGEMVIDAHLVTDYVWEEKAGGIRKCRALHGPTLSDEWAVRLNHDVPWLALTNERDDYGLGVAVETSVAFNPDYGEAAVHRPAYYLYTHHYWGIPVTYCTRGWVYPFSDYHRGDGERGPIIPVRPGSVYLEKMAFAPFFLRDGADRYRDIAEVSKQLRYPLAQRWGR